MEYKKVFNESWEELCELAKTGSFIPYQEQDIVCMMYHLCLDKIKDATLIHSAHSHNPDLMLGRLKGDKNQNFDNCLIAELKFIKRGRKSNVLSDSKQDILELSQWDGSTIMRVFALFDFKGDVTQKEIDQLKQYKDNITVIFGNLK